MEAFFLSLFLSLGFYLKAQSMVQCVFLKLISVHGLFLFTSSELQLFNQVIIGLHMLKYIQVHVNVHCLLRIARGVTCFCKDLLAFLLERQLLLLKVQLFVYISFCSEKKSVDDFYFQKSIELFQKYVYSVQRKERICGLYLIDLLMSCGYKHLQHFC